MAMLCNDIYRIMAIMLINDSDYLAVRCLRNTSKELFVLLTTYDKIDWHHKRQLEKIIGRTGTLTILYWFNHDTSSFDNRSILLSAIRYGNVNIVTRFVVECGDHHHDRMKYVTIDGIGRILQKDIFEELLIYPNSIIIQHFIDIINYNRFTKLITKIIYDDRVDIFEEFLRISSNTYHRFTMRLRNIMMLSNVSSSKYLAKYFLPIIHDQGALRIHKWILNDQILSKRYLNIVSQQWWLLFDRGVSTRDFVENIAPFIDTVELINIIRYAIGSYDIETTRFCQKFLNIPTLTLPYLEVLKINIIGDHTGYYDIYINPNKVRRITFFSAIECELLEAMDAKLYDALLKEFSRTGCSSLKIILEKYQQRS